jgi:predicted double-glycine peptidase
MNRSARLPAAIAFALWLAGAPAFADELTSFIPGMGLVHANVKSLTAERFTGIVRQNTDYSCGAAAVATILKYAYGMPASEWTVISGLLSVSDPALVRQKGFSLLDIKHYVQSIGMQGAGYRLTPQKLFDVQVPVIVLMNVAGYEHFVVLKKATPGYVYLADPLLGNRAIPAAEFLNSWNGIIFVIAAPSYQQTNSLVDVKSPVNPFVGADVPGEAQVLANAELLTIYIPAMSRL